MPCWSSVFALGVGVCRGADADRDGLRHFGVAIVSKFVPAFHISSSDCDVAPAEFDRAAPNPIVKTRNGTIYGQVFVLDRAAPSIEVHFYHFGERTADSRAIRCRCRRSLGLLPADEEWRPEAWRAVFWYAAAAQRILCAIWATGPGQRRWVR